MAELLTIPVTIAVGEVSIYLADNDNSKGVLFGRRLASPKSPIQIAVVTDTLNWQYTDYSTDSTLRGVANYLIWMCGKYSLQAQYIISGSGGGSVIPLPNSTPSPIQFIVNLTTSYMIDGQSSKTVTEFIGYNLLFTRGGVTQSIIDTEPTYYTWNRTTGAFVCVPAALEDELFQLYAIS